MLGSFSIDQSSVDTSQASQTITGTAHVTDDMSGVAQAVVAMCNGQNEVWFSFDAGNLISGDVWDGIYQVSAVLPSYTPQGTWQVCLADTTDAAYNTDILGADRPTASMCPSEWGSCWLSVRGTGLLGQL